MGGSDARAILFRPIAEISADIRLDTEELPADRSEGLFQSPQPYGQGAVNRLAWPELEFMWEAPEFQQARIFISKFGRMASM